MRSVLIASLLLSLAFIPKKDKHPERFVFDLEGVFSAEEEKRLDTLFRGHELRTTNEIVLVTTSSYDGQPDLHAYAATFGEITEVGKKHKDNGVVIAFSKNLREVFIATGVGTEKVMADARCQKYIDSLMIPLFKQDMFFEGVWAGSTAVVTHLELPESRME